MKRYVVGINESGQRMDRFISKILTGASWAEIQKLFRKKVFKRNGSRSVKIGDFLESGDVVEVFLSDESLDKLGAIRFKTDEDYAKKNVCVSKITVAALAKVGIKLIYEDDDFLAVSKPAGMLVHADAPNSKNDLTTLVRRYLSDCADTLFAPSTASRLDRGTSGIVVFAKNYQSLKRMNEAMRDHRIERVYRCVVEGNLSGSGVIELSLYKDAAQNKVFEDCGDGETVSSSGLSPGRQNEVSPERPHESSSGRMEESDVVRSCLCNAERSYEISSRRIASKNSGSTEKKAVKYAKTRYDSEVLRGGGFSLVTAVLETGRTHQIRASLSRIGHPIVGDMKYGSKIRRSSPLLHCSKVEMMGMRFESEAEEINHFIHCLIDG